MKYAVFNEQISEVMNVKDLAVVYICDDINFSTNVLRCFFTIFILSKIGEYLSHHFEVAELHCIEYLNCVLNIQH